MRINVNTGQPLCFIHILDSEYTVTDVIIPTWDDVVFLPEGVAVCNVAQPLKRLDWCLQAHYELTTEDNLNG